MCHLSSSRFVADPLLFRLRAPRLSRNKLQACPTQKKAQTKRLGYRSMAGRKLSLGRVQDTSCNLVVEAISVACKAGSAIRWAFAGLRPYSRLPTETALPQVASTHHLCRHWCNSCAVRARYYMQQRGHLSLVTS